MTVRRPRGGSGPPPPHGGRCLRISAASSAIPTASTWMLMLLAMTLAAAGLWKLR
ncbi:MAG: hypothetical protein ACRD2J_03185 [Thermoanaerobaculia bacterium]